MGEMKWIELFCGYSVLWFTSTIIGRFPSSTHRGFLAMFHTLSTLSREVRIGDVITYCILTMMASPRH